MRLQNLTPSRDLAETSRELHLKLADGQVITIYAIEARRNRIRLGIEAPETVKIHAGALDFQS